MERNVPRGAVAHVPMVCNHLPDSQIFCVCCIYLPQSAESPPEHCHVNIQHHGNIRSYNLPSVMLTNFICYFQILCKRKRTDMIARKKAKLKENVGENADILTVGLTVM